MIWLSVYWSGLIIVEICTVFRRRWKENMWSGNNLFFTRGNFIPIPLVDSPSPLRTQQTMIYWRTGPKCDQLPPIYWKNWIWKWEIVPECCSKVSFLSFSFFKNSLLLKPFARIFLSKLPRSECVCVCVLVFNWLSTNVRHEFRFNFQKHARRTKHLVRVCCWPIRRCRRKLSMDRLQRYLIPTNFSPKLMLAFEWR